MEANMKETYLSYHYQNLMKKTEWLYVTPTESDFSPEIITQECGRFFFDGQSYTERGSLDSYEIGFLLTDTDFKLSYNNSHYTFGKTGDAFFIDCTKGYRLDTQGYADLYFVHFWGDNVKYYYDLFEKHNSGSPILNAASLPIGEEMEKLIGLYRNPSNEIADLYAQTIIMKLMQTLIQAALPLPANTNYSKYMTAAINYIRDHFSEQLTLEQVAQELNISRSYLALIFKKETSLTFSTWLRKYRIGKAKELLKNTNMSQDDICTEVGIYDSSYLCRLFKEYEHLSPDEYRKNWRTVCL